jgi:phage gp29-like protein
VNLKDWFKAIISPKAVSAQQSEDPRFGTLRREFPEHPSKGITPAKLAQIFIAAEQGDLIAQAELFRDMEEKDTHIAAELGKRKMAVKKLEWSLQPPREASALEEKNTKLLEDLIRDELDVGVIRLDMLDAIGHGYACLEMGWGQTKKQLWVPNAIELREPTWFITPPDARNTLHLRSGGEAYGAPLQPWGWIPHIHKSRSGYLARSGLFRVLAWPYLFKNYSVRDLAEFLEIYGLPIRVGKYPAGADDKQKNDLLRAVLSIGHHAAGIIPESMQMELISQTAGGNADAFKGMIDWCEASQSKAILGGTLTTSTAANGNRSLGDVHNEVRLDIRDDDAAQVDQSLSAYLVYPIAMLNGWFADDRSPSFVSDTQEPDDLALYADALPKLAAAGAKIPTRWVNLKLKIPEPEGDEAILGAAMTPAPGEVPPLKVSALKAALTVPVDVDPTPGDNTTQQLAEQTAGVLNDWLGSIEALVNKAESLEALQTDLVNFYGHLDAQELTKVMGLAFAAADLSGRFDVLGGE